MTESKGGVTGSSQALIKPRSKLDVEAVGELSTFLLFRLRSFWRKLLPSSLDLPKPDLISVEPEALDLPNPDAMSVEPEVDGNADVTSVEPEVDGDSWAVEEAAADFLFLK